jgi:hypothetical protein
MKSNWGFPALKLCCLSTFCIYLTLSYPTVHVVVTVWRLGIGCWCILDRNKALCRCVLDTDPMVYSTLDIFMHVGNIKPVVLSPRTYAITCSDRTRLPVLELTYEMDAGRRGSLISHSHSISSYLGSDTDTITVRPFDPASTFALSKLGDIIHAPGTAALKRAQRHDLLLRRDLQVSSPTVD